MADELRAEIAKLGGEVKTMKKEGQVKSEECQSAISKLGELRAALKEIMESEGDGDSHLEVPDKDLLNNLLTRRMFVVPSFDIYNGVAGLYDFGPPACALKANFLAQWRQHFVLEENMLEIECTNLTPHAVLKTSGHVDKFSDLMMKDVGDGTCYRADKLLEEVIDGLLEDEMLPEATREEYRHIRAQADAYGPEEIGKILREQFNVKAPVTGNELSDPFPFNLMFGTQIGPSGNLEGFLRPETAQGIFVNFPKLLTYNAGQMPFACAQIGTGFRNEIAPRNGLLRVREFCMAEIEHFVHPEKKDHPRFGSVADNVLPLFPKSNQIGDGKIQQMSVGDAVKAGTINNETLGYFIARVALFLDSVGIRKTHLRFRQHLDTEMAHYASDCWDAEIYTSYGWVECVGIADRACFDLQQHAKATNTNMTANEIFKTPIEVEVGQVKFNKKVMGKQFKRAAKQLYADIEEALGDDVALAKKLDDDLTADGKATFKSCNGEVELTREMLEIKVVKKKTFHAQVHAIRC
eukprot:INCI17919.2.p1 GENE.INCI17919.2~~INCI17919.2.p1  ORF type:complete len:532 (-),score=113.83 INCI17919.2:586-2151(-)